MARRGRSGADAVLAAALAAGATQADAARKAGVSVRTVARRMKDQAFLDRIAELRLEAQERAIALLGIGTAQAIETITELMGREYSPAIRLRAAVAFATLAAQAQSRGRVPGDEGRPAGLLIDVQPVDYREVVTALAPVEEVAE